LGQRLLIVLVGIVLTVLMQSSGAAIATTLTALNANSVNFDQAALVVIGATIGTTFTGVIASMGASVPARRTAFALMIFNIGAGAGAFLVLPLYLDVLAWVGDAMGVTSGPIRLAAFHTAFVAVGVAIVLPFTYQFARAVERIYPDKGPSLTAHLDNSILALPVLALEAVARVLREAAVESLDALLEGMSQPADEARIGRLEHALLTTQVFFSHIPRQPEHAEGATTRESLLHAMDHLVRLGAYLRPAETVQRALADPRLEEPVRVARATLQLAHEGIHGNLPNGWLLEVEKNSKYLRDWNVHERPRLLEETAAGSRLPSDTLHALDTMRWLARAVDHVSRITHYLRERESEETPSEHERRLA
jgi:phosphate:Na+ symporter